MRRGTAALGLLVVLFLFLFVLEPLPVHAASPLVQQKENDCSSCSPLSVLFTNTVTSGDVVVVTVDARGGTLSSITDSLHSSFTLATSFRCGIPADTCYIYYATLSSSGADTVMLSFPTSFGGVGYVFEVSGVVAPPTLTPRTFLPTGAAIYTTSTNFPTGAFLLGTLVAYSPPVTALGGFALSPSGGSTILFEEYSDPATSPTTFPATQSASAPWYDVGLILNPAPTPPIPEYPLGLPILAILTVIGYGLVRRKAVTKQK